MTYRIRIECYSKTVGTLTEKFYGKDRDSKFYIYRGMMYTVIEADDLEQAKERARGFWKETETRYPDTMKTLKIYEGEVTRLNDLNVKPVFESDNLIGL